MLVASLPGPHQGCHLILGSWVRDRNKTYYYRLTSAHYTCCIRMSTVMSANPCMPAFDQTDLISTALHLIQKDYISCIQSKLSIIDCNGVCIHVKGTVGCVNLACCWWP